MNDFTAGDDGLLADIRQLCAQNPCDGASHESIEWFALPENGGFLRGPAFTGRAFLAQFNPRRTRRAPAGDRCPLCVSLDDNTPSIEIPLSGSSYRLLKNPFPLMENHVTAVYTTNRDEPQSYRVWDGNGVFNSTAAKLRAIIEDLLTLLDRLPGFVVFYNGVGSIPGHLHLQAFLAPRFPLPLQTVAEETSAQPVSVMARSQVRIPNYPLAVYRFSGSRRQLIGDAVALGLAWDHDADDPSFNLIAMRGREREPILYVVPRSNQLFFAPTLKQAIASMEALGILVLSSFDERKMLDDGRVDYQFAWHALQYVNAAGTWDPVSAASRTIDIGDKNDRHPTA